MAIYRVEGLKCDGCVATLSKHLSEKFPGIEAGIDLEGQRISLKADCVESEIRVAVEQAGFKFVGIG